jgi:UDP-N-acetylglucosamine 2-epimerase (non-hydrolysing)
VHRQENVDDVSRLGSIIEGLKRIKGEFNLPVVYPIHPRSKKMVAEFGIETGGINLLEPVGFLEFLQLESNARLVLTDSGGVQEESCILGVPCVTLRDNTERPETIEAGANILAGINPNAIVEKAGVMLGRNNDWVNPFGDGHAAMRIIDIIEGNHG